MTQLETPQSVPSPPQPQKTHVLAILSLVCALLLCIPFIAPVFGVIFGVIALILIPGSDGRSKGKGLAAAGIVISILVLCANVGLIFAGIKIVSSQLVSMTSFIQAVEKSDFATARSNLTENTAAQVSDAQLAQLHDRLESEYGPINAVSLDLLNRAFAQGVAQPSNWDPAQAWQTNLSQSAGPGNVGVPLMLPIKVEFTNKTAFGITELELKTDSTGQPAFLVTSFTLTGDGGPWSFPAQESESNSIE